MCHNCFLLILSSSIPLLIDPPQEKVVDIFIRLGKEIAGGSPSFWGRSFGWVLFDLAAGPRAFLYSSSFSGFVLFFHYYFML